MKELIFRKAVNTDTVLYTPEVYPRALYRLEENKFDINPQERERERAALHYIIQGRLKRKQKESHF